MKDKEEIKFNRFALSVIKLTKNLLEFDMLEDIERRTIFRYLIEILEKSIPSFEKKENYQDPFQKQSKPDYTHYTPDSDLQSYFGEKLFSPIVNKNQSNGNSMSNGGFVTPSIKKQIEKLKMIKNNQYHNFFSEEETNIDDLVKMEILKILQIYILL
jgi:hypothetical protein